MDRFAHNGRRTIYNSNAATEERKEKDLLQIAFTLHTLTWNIRRNVGIAFSFT